MYIAPNAASLAEDAPQIVISGLGFSTTPANDILTFNDGAVGQITAATTTQLTVAFTTQPAAVGPLNATITIPGVGSDGTTQVATIVPTPTVTSNTANLPINASSIVIAGTGFDSNYLDDAVSFNDGAVGTVNPGASPTSLTVTFSTRPSTVGNLTAVVTSYSGPSGAPVQVATVTPVVTQSTANLTANAISITINGFGFDPNMVNDTVTFNDGAIGSVTTASATSLTVTFSTSPVTAGNLTAVVTTDGVPNGTPVQVATVTPVVTSNTTSLPANSSTITINGFGFDTNKANDSVAFNDGAVGSVTTASATSLTVTFSTMPITAGSLTAVVTTDTLSNGAAVQVATITPVVTQNTANLAANATILTIRGFGFDPNKANDSVVLNDGAVGTVTIASATTLRVTFSTQPVTAGSLTAIVTTDTENSGTPVQVATVTPVVTPDTANLAANATSITISGFGFDPNMANDSVVFNDVAVGSVTSASATSLTVTFSTTPVTAGNLTAIVTTDSASSGTPVQVASVAPVVTPNTVNLVANAASITINGFGFDPTKANDSIVFNDGAVGSVTTASATQLVVTITTDPIIAGSLTAVVTTDTLGSGTPVQVATVVPVVTQNTGNLAANALSITIKGFGFDPNEANDSIVFNDGAVGSVTTASPTSLTIAFSTTPVTAGNLTAVITTDTVSSVIPVQVDTVTPVVTQNFANLAANASSIIIGGFGFDPNKANDSIVFNDGAVGSVTTASATSLTVAFSTTPVIAGSLTAAIITDTENSGAPVQVATTIPVVTSNSANLPANVNTLTISGFGFDPNKANDSIVFNDGAFGSVTTASATQLVVTFSTEPITAGSITAVVTTDTLSSGTPVQIATVTPVVTQSSANLAANSTTITISGFGFDPNMTHDALAFNDGAVGNVTTAGPTSLTVTFTTMPVTAGNLTAIVTTDTVSSGTPAQVATVTPVLTPNTANLAANANTITISGFGFDPNNANDSIVFNDGAIGSVTTASATSLTVSFSTTPITAGILTATVTIDSVSSGTPVQVSTVTSVVTPNAANLAADANTITINGFGFDPNVANDSVVFNDGAIGSATAASATSLTIIFSTLPVTAGSLTAVVTTDTVSSGTPVQITVIAPVVTQNTSNLPANLSTITVNGFGFDPSQANDSVVFNDGAVGAVTSASATSLTIAFSTTPVTAGSLTAVVTTDTLSSGTPVQVATVTPVVTQSTANQAANVSSITISGFGFDPNMANDSVSFNDGAAGTVASATSTALDVTFSTTSITAGILTAVVKDDNENSGNAVQVATVVPVVDASAANMASNATTLIINGTGFDTQVNNNSVTLIDVTTPSATITGTVTAATATQLTVTISASGLVTGDAIDALSITNGATSGQTEVATVAPPLSITSSTTILPVGAATLTFLGTGFDQIAADNSIALSDATTGTATIAVSGVSVNAAGTQLTLTFVSSGLVGGDEIDATMMTDGASAGPTEVAVQSNSSVDIVTSTVGIGGTSGLIVTLQPEDSTGQDVIDGTLVNNIAFTETGPAGGSFGPVTFDSITGAYTTLFTPPASGGGPYVFGTTIYGQAISSTTAPVTLAPTAALSSLSLSASGIAIAGPSPTSTPVTLQVKDQFGDNLNTTGLTAQFSANSSQVSFLGSFALNSTTISVTGSGAGLMSGQTIAGPGIAAGTTITTVTANAGTTTIQISEPTTVATTIDFNGTFTKGSRAIVVIGNASGLGVGMPVSGVGIALGTTISKVSISKGKTTLTISKATTSASTAGTSGEAIVAITAETILANTGIFGPVTDNVNGTYSTTYTDSNLDNVTISATLEGSPLSSTAMVMASYADTFQGNSLNTIWETKGGKVAVGTSFKGTFANNATTIAVSGISAGLAAGQTIAGPGITAGSVIAAISVVVGKTTLTISQPTTAASTVNFNGTFKKGSGSIVVVGTATGLAAGVPISGPGIASGTTITKVSISAGTTTLTVSRAAIAASTGGNSGETLVANPPVVLVASDDAVAATGADLTVLNGVVQANLSESLTIAHLASGQTAQLVARYQGPTSSNYYAAGIANSAGKFFAQIFKNVNGALIPLGQVAVQAGLTVTGTGAAAVGSSTIRFDAIGPSLRLYSINGGKLTLLLAVADSSIVAPGSVGVRAIGNAVLSGFIVQPVSLLAPTLPYSDFSGSSSNTADGQLSLNWIDEAGDFTVTPIGLRGHGNSGVAVGGYAASLAVLNGISQANVSESATLNLAVGQTAQLVARYQGPSTRSMYFAGIARTSTGYTLSIMKNLNGIQSVLASKFFTNAQFAAAGFFATSTIRFDVIGPSLRLYVFNGNSPFLVVATADSSIVSPGSVGIRALGGASFANFSASAVNLLTPTLPFSDFTGSSSATPDGQLSLNWIDESGDFTVKSGAAVGGTATSLAVLSGISQANVSESIALGSLAVGQTAQLVARYQGPSTRNMYFAGIARTAAGYTLSILKNFNGIQSVLASKVFTNTQFIAAGFSATSTVRFDVIGPSLRLFLVNGGNPTLVAATADTSIVNPGSVGIRAVGGAALSKFSAVAVNLLSPSLPFTDFTTSNPTADGQLSLNWIDEAGDFITDNPSNPGDAVASNSGTNLAVLSTKVTKTNVQVSAAVSGLKASGAIAGLVAASSGPGNSSLYWGRIVNVGGKFFAQIVKNLNGSSIILVSESLDLLSLSGVGVGQLEFDLTTTPGVPVSMTLLVNGGAGLGGVTISFTDASSTALTAGGNVGISGTTGTNFSNFSAQ